MKYCVIIIALLLTACVAPQPPSVNRVVCLGENDSISYLRELLIEFASENDLNLTDRSEAARTNLLAMGAEFTEGLNHDTIFIFLSFQGGGHFLSAGNISLSSKEAAITTRIENPDGEMLDSLLDVELRDRWYTFQVDDEEIIIYGICTDRLN